MSTRGLPPARRRRHDSPATRWLWVGIAAWLAATTASAQTWAVHGEASLASDLTERGVSQWPQQAAAQALVGVSDGTRWSATLALSAPLDHARDYQAVARGSAYWSASENWQWQAHVGAYAYPGGGYYRFYDRIEAGVGASYRDLWSLDLSAAQLSEDASHTYPAIDLGLRWPLTEQWVLAAGIGRAELMWWPDLWYTYADLGLVWQAGPWRAALRYLGASDSARFYLQRAAEPHTTLSVSWLF
ncbi:hypothetical protein [Ideonella sp.]|uniref:hypothetical protein n=1 Tax=Ideonella sp. TaxID=1929293 RepID=UPI0035AFA669